MGYPLLIGICVVLTAFAGYYFLWPASRGTMQSTTQQKPAESSNPQADTAVNDPLKLSEKIEKEPTQAPSKIETDPAQPSVDTAVNDPLKLSELIEKKQTQASSKSETDPAQPSVEKGAQVKAVPKNEIAVAARQPEISTDQTTPTSGKGPNDLALLFAASDAKPKPQPDKTTQKAAIKKQEAQYSNTETTVADRQPEISSDQAAPAHDQIPAKPEVENDVTLPAKAENKGVSMAALPDARPKPQVDNQTPANKDTQPEKVSSGNRPDPLVTAKTETQLQPSTEQSGVTEPPVEQEGSNGLENRLRSFLQNYCTTYAAKDLDAFTILFAPNASENGKPFESLLPRYQRNFSFIETIQYRIELQQFSYDDNKEIVEVDGNFFLKWLSPKKKWRENSGTISMSLKENGASFLVERLDYQSTHSKKSNPEQ